MAAQRDNGAGDGYVGLTLSLAFDHPLGDLREHLEALAEGRALANRCPACRRAWFPPRRVCCGRMLEANWVSLPGTGTVLAVTHTERIVPFAGERESLGLALVALDGTDNAAVGWLTTGGTAAPGARVRLVASVEGAVHPVQCARFMPVEG